MFVKIIDGGCEAVHECRRVYSSHSESSDPEGCYLDLTLESNEPLGSVSVRVPKSVHRRVAVFLMNDKGVTFDTLFKNF